MQQSLGFFSLFFQIVSATNQRELREEGGCRNEATLLGWEDGERTVTPEKKARKSLAVICRLLIFVMHTHIPCDHKEAWKATDTEQHHLSTDSTQAAWKKVKIFNVQLDFLLRDESNEKTGPGF